MLDPTPHAAIEAHMMPLAKICHKGGGATQAADPKFATKAPGSLATQASPVKKKCLDGPWVIGHKGLASKKDQVPGPGYPALRSGTCNRIGENQVPWPGHLALRSGT